MAINVVTGVTPNVGSVVNQNQGFVMDVAVSLPADALVNLQDCVLKITHIDADITVGVGLNVPISLPTVAIGGTESVKVVFETESGIAVGGKSIEYELVGYLGGPEWLVIHRNHGYVFNESLHEVFPSWRTTGTQELEIHPE